MLDYKGDGRNVAYVEQRCPCYQQKQAGLKASIVLLNGKWVATRPMLILVNTRAYAQIFRYFFGEKT